MPPPMPTNWQMAFQQLNAKMNAIADRKAQEDKMTAQQNTAIATITAALQAQEHQLTF